MRHNDVAEMVADWQGAGDWIPFVNENMPQWKWHKDTLLRLSKILKKIGVDIPYMKHDPETYTLHSITLK